MAKLQALFLLASCYSSAIDDERAFWNLCINDKGEIELPSDEPPYAPPCADPVQVFYGEVPILVSIDHSAEKVSGDVLVAVDFWNAAVGFKLFEQAKDRNIARVFVFGESENALFNGVAQPFVHAGKFYSAVLIFGDPGVATIVHELGHALGLAHDEDSPHVMRPSPKARISISNTDLRAVRRKYADIR